MVVADYYAMLGVDPGADRAAIEAALAKAQPAWSAGTRNPKNKHTFQSYLDRIPAIRQALLGDPASRAAYDAELAAAQRAEHDAKVDQFQKLVMLRAAKGGLTVSDRNLLRAEAQRLGVGNVEYDRLLEPFPPLPESPAEVEAAEPTPDVLDAAARRQIRIALDHIRRRDLYDALGLPRDAPIAEIAAQGDAERQKWMHKTQVTAEKTAWLEAISYAQSHLATPEARARYDRTLRFEAEEALTAAIEFALKGTAHVAASTRELLRNEAASSGITPERADRLIDRACRALGVSREAGPSPVRLEGLIRFLRCRNCSGLTEYALASRSSESAVCRHCRASLRWDCPVCRRHRWVDETRCACGFPLEYVEPLVRYFEAAQHAHRARDFVTALANLKKVQEFAPKHIGARKGIEKIKERLAEIDQARAAYEAQRARRHLVAARSAVVAWGRLVDPTSPDLRRAFAEVTEVLRQAMALSAKAEAIADSDPKASRVLYRQALSIAADLAEAREGLRHSPPPPPSDLIATIAGDRVRLRWSAAPNDGLGPCTYRIQRKRGAVPSRAEDGIEVAEVAATEYEDTSVTPGDTVGYSVFSVRGAVPSTAGASAGPVPILADVTELKAEGASREVVLSWTTPPNCFDVRVVRKVGSAPSGPEDGTPIAALRGQALDRGLVDETVYHYGVFVLYRTSDGRAVPSRGAFVSCMPSPPILTILEPRITREVDGVRIAWTPPERGQVQVFRSEKPFPFPPGEWIERRMVDGLSGAWVARTAPDHVVDRPPAGSSSHYTPLIAWAGRLTVGRSVAYSHRADASGLRAVPMGRSGRIALRWTWPEGASAAVIAVRRNTDPIGPSDPAAATVRITREEYEALDSSMLTLPAGQPMGPWHIAVYALYKQDDEELAAPGLEQSGRTVVGGRASQTEVSYILIPPRLMGRDWTLAFTSDPPGASIPPTVLVAHPRTVPFAADDGEILARFPATTDGARFPFRIERKSRKSRLRIFPDPASNPDSLAPIRLRHPEAEATRV